MSTSKPDEYVYIVKSNVPLALIGNGASDIPMLRQDQYRAIDYNGQTLRGRALLGVGRTNIFAYRIRDADVIHVR